MGQKLFEDKIGALSEGGGFITLAPSRLTIGGQQYITASLQLAIPSLTANTLYMIYAVVSSGVVSLVQSTNFNSVGPLGYLRWKLVGAYYSNGGPPTLTSLAATTIAFGSFVNIEGVPKSTWIPYNLVPGGTTTPPTKATLRVNDEARWMRIGDICWMYYAYHHNNNAGSAIGSGIYLFPIPSNIGNYDTTKIGAIGQDANGRTTIGSTGTTMSANGLGWVKFHDGTNVRLTSTNNNATVNAPADVSSTFFSWASGSYGVGFMINFPVTGFSNTPLKDL